MSKEASKLITNSGFSIECEVDGRVLDEHRRSPEQSSLTCASVPRRVGKSRLWNNSIISELHARLETRLENSPKHIEWWPEESGLSGLDSIFNSSGAIIVSSEEQPDNKLDKIQALVMTLQAIKNKKEATLKRRLYGSW